MRSYNGAVQQNILHIRIIGEMLMHFFPHLMLTPARKAFVNAVPVTVAFRKQSPLGSTPQDPHYCLDELAAIYLLSSVHSWMAL